MEQIDKQTEVDELKHVELNERNRSLCLHVCPGLPSKHSIHTKQRVF